MRLFDLIKRKLFNEPPPLVDCVRDKEWYERKYGKEVSKYMKREEDGQKKFEGSFKDGKKDGPFTWWYGNGKKEYEGTYKNGKKISVKEWNEDGSIKE